MARKSPVELTTMALEMYRRGPAPKRIADIPGLDPQSVQTRITRHRQHQTAPTAVDDPRRA